MKIDLRILVVSGIAGAAALACGSEPEPPSMAAAPSRTREEVPEPVAALPRLTGDFRISVVGDRITLEATEAERGATASAGEGEADRRLHRLPRHERLSISQEERARLRAEFEARDAAARAALDAEDPPVRAEAIADVDIDGPGRDRIFALAAKDPNPEVRAEAVKLLGEEDSMAARDALYAALQDPTSEVVMEALDWIEAVGDASSIPYLDPLIDNHPSDRVRDRAFWVRSFLEE